MKLLLHVGESPLFLLALGPPNTQEGRGDVLGRFPSVLRKQLVVPVTGPVNDSGVRC